MSAAHPGPSSANRCLGVLRRDCVHLDSWLWIASFLQLGVVKNVGSQRIVYTLDIVITEAVGAQENIRGQDSCI
jgi:hypothetical protein